MRLINSYELKQKLLDDRDLLVPKTVNTPFAQAVRYGFHRALRCMEQCTTIEAEPVMHGRWERARGDIHSSGYSVICTECGKYHFVHFRGTLGGLYGHDELFTEPSLCPNCGAKMDGGAEDD